MPVCSVPLACLVMAAAGPNGLAALPPHVCAPAANLSGEPGAVAPIGRLLVRRGISRSDRGGCAPLTVTVALATSGFDVLITDPEGRTSRRTLGSAEAAATLIESWARADLADPLFAERSVVQSATPAASPRLPSSSPPPSPSSSATEAGSRWGPAEETAAPAPPAAPAIREPAIQELERPVDATGPAPRESPAPRRTLPGARHPLAFATVSALGETAMATDRAVWTGAGGGACLRIGFTCAGLTGHWATTDGSDQTPFAPGAWDGEALVSLLAPVALGRAWLIPLLGIGVGRLSGMASDPITTLARPRYGRAGGNSHGHDGNRGHSGQGAGSMPAASTVSPAPVPVPTTTSLGGEQSFHADSWRAGAGLGISIPLAGGLAVQVQVEAATSFGSFDAMGPVSADSSPRRLRAGLGLRYGQR